MHNFFNQRVRTRAVKLGFLAAISSAPLYGQLTINDLRSSSITPEVLAQTIAGSGVSISNVVYNEGIPASTQTNLASGTFSSRNPELIGFTNGIILSSGTASSLSINNISENIQNTSSNIGTTGKDDLNILANLNNNTDFTTEDSTVLEFNFTPNSDSIAVEFVFASEEYNRFIDSEFNDVFGFFINGINCATLPNGAPVTINTINNGNPFDQNGLTGPNAALFRNNDPTEDNPTDDEPTLLIQSNGLTKIITCVSPVFPGTENTLRLAIADTEDSSFDSWVMIRRGSLTTTTPIEVTCVASSSTSSPNDTESYTITVTNREPTAALIREVVNTLPEGFSYIGPTTGDITNNPIASGQILRWRGNRVVPGNGSISLTFPVLTSSEIGTFYNNATVESPSRAVRSTGDASPIWITEETFVSTTSCGTSPLQGGNYQPSAYDHFGHAVSIDGDHCVISRAFSNEAGINSGGACFYRKINGEWVSTQSALPSDIRPVDWFGTRTDLKGNVAAISSIRDDKRRDGDSLGVVDSGSVYVYRFNGTSWWQTAQLIPSDPIRSLEFGSDLEISEDGNRIAVGTKGRVVYVFRNDGGQTWVEEAKIVTTDSTRGQFGTKVAFDGSTLAISDRQARNVNNPIRSSGKVFVYSRTGFNWSLEATIEPPASERTVRFGQSLEFDQGRIAVAATANIVNGISASSSVVFVFRKNGAGDWIQEAKIIPNDPDRNDNFGTSFTGSVCIRGDRMFVGAYGDDDVGSLSGSLYVFRRTGNSWNQESKITASDGGALDYFGQCVDASDSDIVVGAEGYDTPDGVEAAGAAYIFSRN